MGELTVYGVGAVVLVLVWFAVRGWISWNREPSPSAQGRGNRQLPVLNGQKKARRCEDCANWNLEHGQRLMQKHQPFALAAQHVSPSQMGVPVRAFRSNPEYERVRAALDKALDEGAPDHELRALQAELEVLNPQVVDVDAVKVDPRVEVLTWEDFGACLQHREIRARNDQCDRFVSKQAHPDLADDLEPEVHA